ncbi:ABC transporter substrate-binding protein [Mesorhizobium sp. M0029]|uniref:ABC transporter substrate-binding protein n=1 Tax=Mesorhizobium sp. M0029 TaxID=2956850 RepID=UPI003339FDC7
MTISRRDLFKVGLAAGTALSMPAIVRAQTAPTGARTVRLAKLNDLRVFDPVASTEGDTADHGLAIYDTLFAVDSKLIPQPQMVEKWGVSDDKRTYTFQLRDGLGWHDGTPVTAADCVASIRRWGGVAPGGQLLTASAKDISKKDDRIFTIALKEPLGILLDILAGVTTPLPFMMREQDANRPSSELVTANIGSGPFKFNQELARPGVSFTYDRNDKYVPRQEAPDGLAGGKIVKVDQAIWNVIPDQQTSFAALQAGEIDIFVFPSADLYPLIESDPNLVLEVMNTSGSDLIMRMNHLQKPFNNVKARQAMLHLVDQEAFIGVVSPDPKYGRTVTSIFGNTSPVSNDENTGWYKKGGDPERAKQLFQEAGYAGEKVVILQSTDWPQADSAAQLLAQALQKIGINAELAPSDWGGVTARRQKKDPVEQGGWSIHITNEYDNALGNPLASPFLVASGDAAWVGWPKNDEYEALRAKWASVETLEERKSLAREMQKVWWDFVGDVRLCQFIDAIGRRKSLTGIVSAPFLHPMWNMQRA